MSNNIWYPLPGFPSHEATVTGRVRSPRGELHPYNDGRKSLVVDIRSGGKCKRLTVAQIVRMLQQDAMVTA